MSDFISLTTAETMTGSYRTNRESILASTYQHQDILALNETFERTHIDALLAQQGCEKLRVYYGMNEDLQVHAIFVGVDNDDNDMLPGENNDYRIVELGNRCPSQCPPASSLNT